MIKTNDVIHYNNEKYKVLVVYDTGYCEIKKLTPSGPVELVHRKDIKDCLKVVE